MLGKPAGPIQIQTRCTPVDETLATNQKQWAEWRLSRRRLIEVGAFGGAGLALGGALSRPLVRSAAAQDEQPKPGGAIRMSLADDDIQSFDPIIPTDNMSIWTMLLIYDQLIRVGPDGTSLEPGLAESWEASADGLTYTFHLRDAAFHDGSPCTSADVVYSLTRVVQLEDSQWSFLFSAVDTVEATDPATVVVRLKNVWAPFEADLALFGASIIPQALHEAQQEELFQSPIGTGPFVFDSWEKQSQVVLKKNPSYWDTGKPYLDELTFSVLIDSNARMLQFQGGELDIVTDVPFSQVESLKANPDVVLLEDAVARIDYATMNVARPPLDDKNLRQAINYAVNKEEIIANVLFGAAVPATTYLPLMAGHDDTAPGYPFDLAKAKERVAQSAGKDGFELEMLIGAGDPTGSQVAQLVAAHLAEIGGNITVTALEPGIARARRNAFDFDLLLGYYTTDIIDPDELTTFAVQSDGGTFSVWTQYKNDQVDTLVKQAETTTDQEQRLELYKEIQRLHADDAPYLFLFYPTGRTATQQYVKNFRILSTGNYRLWETWRDDG